MWGGRPGGAHPDANPFRHDARVSTTPNGMIAAGHPATAEAGARVLREGGNAVDAAVGAVLASWVAEPLLTGPGAGGYRLVAGAGEEPTLLDVFVEAPGRGADPSQRADLLPAEVSFGDAAQVFNVGPASCGTPGSPAGLAAALERWGSVPAAELAAPAAAMAREGVTLNAEQAYIFEILEPILCTTPEAQAIFAPGGRALREGECFRDPELGETIERFGAEGAEPFYRGDIAHALVDWLEAGGGQLTLADLDAYEAVPREPVHVKYRGRQVLTNPPPSAGGTLLALAMAKLDATSPGPPAITQIVDVMEEVQAERTPEFLEGLQEARFADRFLASRLGSTTHISVIDRDGLACSVTCTNGEGAGVVVPGTGVHVNNIMGEQDLSPLGFFRYPPGRRMPSMMAPTAVLDAHGEVELVLGSAGSNRIRSAILQVIVGVVDHGMRAREAVLAPRVHFEDGLVYAEPGAGRDELRAAGREIVAFRGPNLFFGGAQAVERDVATRALSGAGDPRRGGVAVAA
ncbi:MAG: gamma-glutamyltranspeptidase / glutathione hydrolase [Solirubrobacteraceae bacterium]|nr:gamma-glutamyltranspeptidase / glutathione hydrolase [Solirubrobacteraceae bacterium]